VIFKEGTTDRRRWVPIPIRLVLGMGFVVHGWAKWSRGPAAFAELLKQADVPLPTASAWLVTLLEIFGGFAHLMGAFVAIVRHPTDLFDAGRDVYGKHQVRALVLRRVSVASRSRAELACRRSMSLRS